ncbi:MAG: NmrA/HSCARG family protein [Anaerolineae bacterium]|nr:NmrA/HSCARG family protein [Anaerolineae bacterium]
MVCLEEQSAAYKQVLVFGATGNIGGAAARALLKRGWRVRAVTRNPSSVKAQALATLGAELCQADMEDPASLEAAFGGIKRAFSVQNWTTSGVAGEIRQGKLVADAARRAGVEHLVYGSAGTGEPDSGVPHFDSKLEVEAYMRALGLPTTVIRPGPFMELMADKQFFPPAGIWGTGTRIMGWDTPSPWIAVDDIGVAIANIFAAPAKWVGKEVELIGDVKSLAECRQAFVERAGKQPFRLPLPLWLFRRMAGEEMIVMWQWLVDYVAAQGSAAMWQTVETTRELSPGLLDVESWLDRTRTAA